MKMTSEQFVQYMKRSFDAGYQGYNRNQLIQEIVAELGPPEVEESESEFRIYSLEELRSAPDGATFASEDLGPFRIESYSGSKFGIFPSSSLIAYVGLNCSAYPLNKGIRKLSQDEYCELAKGNEKA